MKHYSLIFLFNQNKTHIVLITKDDEIYNGLGGKFDEEDINIEVCAERECNEESNLAVSGLDKFAVLKFEDMQVHVFRAIATFPNAYSYTTEEGLVQSINLDELKDITLVANSKWLIELALAYEDDRKYVEVFYD